MCCFIIPANIPQKKPKQNKKKDWSRLKNVARPFIFVTWLNSQVFPAVLATAESKIRVKSKRRKARGASCVARNSFFFHATISRSLRKQRRNLAISISCLVSNAHIYRGFTYPHKDAKFTTECWWYRSLFRWNIKTREDHR